MLPHRLVHRLPIRPTPALVCLLLAALPAPAEEWDVRSDTWVAVDGLGRRLPGPDECGPPRPDKVVGIFYFIWHGQHGTAGPFDITRLLAENPADPNWGPEGAFHHWGEAEDGYYLPDDEYVIRKHSRELVNAGVDVIVFDVTNAFRYTPVYMKLCEVYRDLRSRGERTPQICFLTHSSSVEVVQQLYDEFYAPNLYPELWFRWNDKPLMLADLEGHSQAVRDFFTIRYSWAWDSGYLKWSWIDHYPQKPGYEVPDRPEWIPVASAQHPVSNIGRSFHNGAQPAPQDRRTAEGLCFAEQWRRALEVDPAMVFITGWNEWVAQRFINNGQQPFLGSVPPAGSTFFVDQYDQEYSRDLEPMKGGHGDAYYYQMVANIRRYKGVRAPETARGFKTIAIDGDFSDWEDVSPEFRDHVGDPVQRNHAGWGEAGPYVNTSGRNDLKIMKVAVDLDHVYFLARCDGPLTSPDGSAWMALFINADEDASTGWEGYDLVVNRAASGADTAVVETHRGGWNWEAAATVPMRVDGDALELSIPRSLLGGRLRFEFKWADHIPGQGEVTEFSTHGDSAPDRRFNYQFSAEGAWDTQSDTWVATDALNRSLPTHADVGPPRPDRQVGMFYFLWMGQHGIGGPYDITRILAEHPNAMENPNSPPWGPLNAFHHWGESIFGYYLSDDRWVIRKHAQMLADAGVDAIIFDVTNNFTYKDNYMALLETFADVRSRGGRTPQVVFLTPFWNPTNVVRQLYDDLYGPGLHQDLWYRWNGKPLIMADPAGVEESLRGFFTFRKPIPGYLSGPSGPNQWAWLEVHPQHVYYSSVDYGGGTGFEFDTPGQAEGWVAQNHVANPVVADGALRVDITGADPYVIGPEISLSAAAAPYVTLRLRTTAPGTGQLYWATQARPAMHEDMHVDFAVTDTGEFVNVVLDLRQHPHWTGTVTRLRVDPPGNGTVELDFVRIAPEPLTGPAAGTAEQMVVGVAQNAWGTHTPSAFSEANTYGRSWHRGGKDPAPDAVDWGYNFQEQWDRALEVDPRFVFVTGWNEWVAMRLDEFNGVREPVMFVDQFTQEYSRDIEPMVGGHTDNYYYQLVENVRRYKGARPVPQVTGPSAISIDGDFGDWKDVAPAYRDDIGDTAHRDHPGWGEAGPYADQTGRNDIIETKVAYDAGHIYFYARTAAPLSPATDPHWMTLLLDTDRQRATGWEGYDFAINRLRDGHTAQVEGRGPSGWEPRGTAQLRVGVSELELSVPRPLLGVDDRLGFEVKWIDHIDLDGDILDFIRHGDAAPNGRFNYLIQAMDSDGDGLPDAWETAQGLDPQNPDGDDGPGGDPDGDGLSNLEELANGTNPF